MKRQQGVTLIETILCLGLITIAALGLIAALTRLMVAQSSSSHQTVARIIADSKLQKAMLSGPDNNWNPNPPDPYTLGDVLQESARVGQKSDMVTFYYMIADYPDTDVVNPPASFDANNPALPQMGKMYKVTIRVWWNADDNEDHGRAAVERGTQTIEVTALTYIET